MAVTSPILSATLAALLVATTTQTAPNTAPVCPPRLESYLTDGVGLTGAQKKQLVAGAPVTKLLDVDEGNEVAIFGAIWIEAPIRRYVEAVADIENFERGGSFKVTRRISSPPKLEDFADLHLREEDVKDLRTCRIGDCVVKLDAEAIQRLRAEVDWKSPDVLAAVDRVMQRFVLLYVNGYLEGGSVTGPWLLVRHPQPKPVGRPQRRHWALCPGARTQRGAKGNGGRASGDQAVDRGIPLTREGPGRPKRDRGVSPFAARANHLTWESAAPIRVESFRCPTQPRRRRPTRRFGGRSGCSGNAASRRPGSPSWA